MRRWLREPLLHFVVLGLAIFGAFRVLGPVQQQRSSIHVTQGMIDGQVEAFSRTWLRPPTQQEFDELIRQYIREEIYYREGLALGLDRDDTVIRRRLQQKVEFVAEAEGMTAEPTDDQLRTQLDAHPELYRTDDRFTFVHIYLDAERHGAALTQDAARLLVRVSAGDATLDPADLGDATMLERSYDDVALRDVAAQLGNEFAKELRKLPVGKWQGPITSAYGAHLVKVSERTVGRDPQLNDVRETVRRDWMNNKRIAANEAYYRSLRQRYTVTVAGRAMTGPDEATAQSAK